MTSYNSAVILRRHTSTISVGSVEIGSSAPIVVQSMTKVPTTDVSACVEQVNRLVRAGCGLVRIAVPRRADTAAFAQIVEQVTVPLIADVHFSADRAIEAIEAGAAKIRLNPGNIKKREDIFRIIDAYDAMRSARVYREPLDERTALREIRENSGKQFDPKVVEAFLECQEEIEACLTRAEE